MITKPTGNIPNVRPGNKNSVVPPDDDCAEEFADEGGALVWVSAKAPFRNDASWGESSDLRSVPSLVVPEREMVGIKDERTEALGKGAKVLANRK